jgi:hypothetical protein
MKIIRFFSKKENLSMGEPKPMKTLIPQWWKDGESHLSSGHAGMKKCVPFLDIMVAGYALTLPVDIYVSKNDDGSLKIGWNSPKAFEGFIGERPKELGETIPRPAGHYENHLVFKGFWGMRTPKGWSLLVTHPFNRYDLPFTTMSGLVDSDEYSAPGNIPFFIKEDFVGIIPAGTPFAQLVPVKRDNWKMMEDKGLVGLEAIHGGVVRTTGKSYKKLFWHRKDYN